MRAQSLAALEVANRTRRESADVRREIAAGLSIEEALADPRSGAMPIGRLLRAIPRYGEMKTARLMRQVGVTSTKRVRDLTDRQRHELVLRLEFDAKRRDPRVIRREIRHNGTSLIDRAGAAETAPPTATEVEVPMRRAPYTTGEVTA